MPTSIRSEATRSVVVVNGADKLAINEDGSMELLAPAANPTGNDVPTAGQLGFGKMYESPAQTITVGGSLSLLHNLIAKPKLAMATLVCKVAEHGYSVGDEVNISAFQPVQSAGAAYGVGLVPTDSTIECRYANGAGVFFVPNKATGAIALINTLNWRLIVRAWA